MTIDLKRLRHRRIFGSGDMKMDTRTLLPFAALVVAFATIAPAHAQLARTFISADGNDANPCSRVLPCRSLTAAHAATIAGGEINMLDPAGYGTVTITKAISIVNDGVGSAGVLVPSGQTGITINAGPNDAVNLRGLIIEGTNVGSQGIRFNSGKSLTIENCVVRNVLANGISFYPATSSSLVVSHTFVSDVGARGIDVGPVFNANGSWKVAINRSEVHNTGDIGMFAHGTGSIGTIDMTISDSVASGSQSEGMRANSLAGASTTLTIVRSVAIGNDTGVSAANGNATVRVSQSTIAGNANGWSISGGATLQSYGDNNVNGNAANEGAMPLVSKK
jgi:hypothetical protein